MVTGLAMVVTATGLAAAARRGTGRASTECVSVVDTAGVVDMADMVEEVDVVEVGDVGQLSCTTPSPTSVAGARVVGSTTRLADCDEEGMQHIRAASTVFCTPTRQPSAGAAATRALLTACITLATSCAIITALLADMLA